MCLSVCTLPVHASLLHFTHTCEGVGVVALRKLAESRVDVLCRGVYTVHILIGNLSDSFDIQNNNYLLATFRCHDANRLEIKVHTP